MMARTRGEPLVTSDHVLVETRLLLARRLGRAAAERHWEGARAGGTAVEPVSDQDFSIVDRTSFAVMQRLGVDRATLDEDFAIFRFGRNRTRAFEIVR